MAPVSHTFGKTSLGTLVGAPYPIVLFLRGALDLSLWLMPHSPVHCPASQLSSIQRRRRLQSSPGRRVTVLGRLRKNSCVNIHGGGVGASNTDVRQVERAGLKRVESGNPRGGMWVWNVPRWESLGGAGLEATTLR